jgi:hypothetical protein
MPELAIRQKLWDEFRLVAERQNRRPEALAQQVLREYVKRCSDEELIARSSELACRAPFALKETEEVIGGYRRQKR